MNSLLDRKGELLQKADAALYGAKNSGRDRILSWNEVNHSGLIGKKKSDDVVNTMRNGRAVRDK